MPQTPPLGSSLKFQSAEEVASVIEHPVPEIFTNPAQMEIARRYYADIVAFEANL